MFPPRYHTQNPVEQRHLRGEGERGWVSKNVWTRRKGSRSPVQNNPHEQRNRLEIVWPQTDAQIEIDRRRLTDEVTDSAEPALVLRAKDVAMRLAGRLAAHDRREPSMVSLHVEKRSSELDNWTTFRPGVSHPHSQLAVQSSKQQDDVFVGSASPRRRPSSEVIHPSALPLVPSRKAVVDRWLRFVRHCGTLLAIQVSANEHLSCVILLMNE